MSRSHALPLSIRQTGRDILAGTKGRRSPAVLGFMSAQPGEGVSTICVGLANVFAVTGRVLLVDASSEGRSIATLLRAERRPLTANAPPSPVGDWIVPTRNAGVDLLTLLPREECIRALAAHLAEVRPGQGLPYFFTVVDLGSLRSVPTHAWADILHHAYVVVDSSRTIGDTLAQARRELDQLKYPMAGAIMNRRLPAVADRGVRG